MTTESTLLTLVIAAGYFLALISFIAHALLRRHREPASRLAWLILLIVAPLVGMAAYVLLGDTNIGRRQKQRMADVLTRLPPPGEVGGEPSTPSHTYLPLFRVGESINGFLPVNGNTAQLLGDSDATINAIVLDIDQATTTVHLLFYIWLPDNNGIKIVEALKRAAKRQVICRVMADDLGSRALIRSSHWQDMARAGVRVSAALPIGSALFRILSRRIDMRNHRKIVVIDNRVTYCGSQNCADAAFLPKKKYAPWVDVMLRLEGPVVRQKQFLFATDWMSANNEDDIGDLLRESPVEMPEIGFVAQVIGSGAHVRYSAMPEIFGELMSIARHELIITTPYYVPDEPIQAALCASARRGVATTIILPERNDSWIVAAASRSYYEDLLEAGVRIFEYSGGLLHSKTLTLDGEVSLIGSANIDRRSFELNFENNILLHDRGTTRLLRQRQADYLNRSRQIHLHEVTKWPWFRRLWNNAVAMLGHVL